MLHGLLARSMEQSSYIVIQASPVEQLVVA
jgi:hypothetical protein